jgi:nucleoside-diphosphate-sugar epimerase
LRLLFLGGSGFLGRHLVEAAVERGHEVTLFNRGRTNPELFPEVEKLRGDRENDLEALRGRRWDAVVDVHGRIPRHVEASASALAETEHYTFVSSISAYADFSRSGIDETAPIREYDPSMGDEDMEFYGARKAECERIVAAAFPAGALIVRPGLIVGPHDPTDRFTYWPRRIARGGDVLAPGDPERRVELVDARDLAEWIVRMVAERQTGVYNAGGPDDSLTMGQLLEACAAADGGDAELVWVDDDFLLERGVGEWMELPLWLVDREWRGMLEVDVSRAIEAGITFRPIVETARDTLEWDRTRGEYEPEAGMAPEREVELLAEWRSRA